MKSLRRGGVQAAPVYPFHHFAVVGQFLDRKVCHRGDEFHLVGIVGQHRNRHAGRFFLSRSVVQQEAVKICEDRLGPGRWRGQAQW